MERKERRKKDVRKEEDRGGEKRRRDWREGWCGGIEKGQARIKYSELFSEMIIISFVTLAQIISV